MTTHEPSASNDLAPRSVRELFSLQRATLVELRRRDLVRTMNAPQGDWAELLVGHAYSGMLAPNSVKSFDVLTDDDRRIQVKCRTAPPSGKRVGTLSPFRSWDFHLCVVVLFRFEDLSVLRAGAFTADAIQARCHYSAQVNGHRATVNGPLWDAGTDATAKLQDAEVALSIPGAPLPGRLSPAEAAQLDPFLP